MFVYLVIILITFSCGLSAGDSITFRVDMRQMMRHGAVDVSMGDSPIVRGSFNNWLDSSHMLVDSDGDSMFTNILEIEGAAGDAVDYKFVIRSPRHGDIWEENPNPGNPPYGNRRLLLTGDDQILPIATFKSPPYFLGYENAFSKEKLRADFLQMREMIEELHPALYEFTAKAVFDSLFDSGLASINSSGSASDFYKIAAPLVARIGCGHSNLKLPEGWWQNAPDRLFPLRLWFNKSTAYVVEHFSNMECIPLGSEIVAINDVPILRIGTDIVAVLPADGHNLHYRLDRLNRRFPYLYAVMYGFPEEFTITYRLPESTENAVAILEPVTSLAVEDAKAWSSILSLEIDAGKSVATVTINNFYFHQDNEPFATFIDSVFAAVQKKGLENLILDLRDNDGGDPFCTSYLLSYIEPEPVVYFDRPFGKYGVLAKPIPRADSPFEGNLYVLINGRNFSSTAHLLALLDYHNIGVLVGSETGGTYTCNDAKETVLLTNTRFPLQVARESFSVAVDGMPKDRGIVPDIAVQPRIEDIINGRDNTLETVLEMIE